MKAPFWSVFLAATLAPSLCAASGSTIEGTVSSAATSMTVEQPGLPARHFLPGASPEETIRSTDWDVLVATITAVSTHSPTNGNPPRVKLKVHQVLSGASRPQDIDAIWDPFGHGVDWEGGGRPEAIARWSSQPMESPEKGARMLLLGEGSPFHVSPDGRYKWTADLQQQAIGALRARKRDHERTANEAKAERAKIEARRRSWRGSATPETIARSARDADFIGIGRLSSGPNDDSATFEITTIFKGVRRKPYIGSAYFAEVHVPAGASDLLEWDQSPELLVFLTENGMDLDRAPFYPLSGDGLVIADAEARKVVQDTLAHTAGRPQLPLCVVTTAGYAGLLSVEENRALKARIADAFTAAGEGRCIVGTSSALTSMSPTDWVGDTIRRMFLGASRAVLVSIGNGGDASLSGIRIGPDQTTAVFSGEPWPSAVPDQRITAQRLLNHLVAAE